MRGDKPNEMRNKPQMEQQEHPDEYQGDLNPDARAAQNIGPQAADREKGLKTAYDLKPVHRALHEFPDDDLKQIPVLPAGTRLQQGAVYLDLNDADRKEVKATGQMEAGPDNHYVPKSEVPFPVWNRLRGLDSQERL